MLEQDQKFKTIHGDSLDVLKTYPDNYFDSIVTDPPYGLSFMGKKWDYDVPSIELWQECLRVLKPGGHLLAFAGTRTQHRMAVRIEDAGFEIRDMIAWVYGSGFPKSLDVSKAIDKAAGEEREVVGVRADFSARANKKRIGVSWADGSVDDGSFSNPDTVGQITAPATEAARQWQGWGTALKPALEPITVARKPLIGTVADNVLTHGTGAINIDVCRVGTETRTNASKPNSYRNGFVDGFVVGTESQKHNYGRWPANLIHDGSEEVVATFPQEVTKSTGGKNSKGGMGKRVFGAYALDKTAQNTGGLGDQGTPARFFYAAKASKRDRGEGNTHPTVKPTDLMRYLCRLVTPPNGIVLDPFMGSGSTGKAAILEGFRFVGIDREEQYAEIAESRIKNAESSDTMKTSKSKKKESSKIENIDDTNQLDFD